MNVTALFSENSHNHIADESSEILTMAFVNFQPFDKVYSLSDAFCAGTLFPDLDKPFLAGGHRK